MKVSCLAVLFQEHVLTASQPWLRSPAETAQRVLGARPWRSACGVRGVCCARDMRGARVRARECVCERRWASAQARNTVEKRLALTHQPNLYLEPKWLR